MHAICNEIRLFYNTNSWQKVSISGKVHQSASYRPIPLCSAAFNELIKCKSKLAHSYALTLLSISWWGMHHQNRQVVWGRSELRSFWIACSLLILHTVENQCYDAELDRDLYLFSYLLMFQAILGRWFRIWWLEIHVTSPLTSRARSCQVSTCQFVFFHHSNE